MVFDGPLFILEFSQQFFSTDNRTARKSRCAQSFLQKSSSMSIGVVFKEKSKTHQFRPSERPPVRGGNALFVLVLDVFDGPLFVLELIFPADFFRSIVDDIMAYNKIENADRGGGAR